MAFVEGSFWNSFASYCEKNMTFHTTCPGHIMSERHGSGGVVGTEKGQEARVLTSLCTFESKGERPSDNVDIPARFTSPYRGLDGARRRSLLLEQDSAGDLLAPERRIELIMTYKLFIESKALPKLCLPFSKGNHNSY